MKKSISNTVQSFIAIVVLATWTLGAAAQDSSRTTTSTTSSNTSTGFQVQPWMWIVGVIVLVLIIIALMSGRKTDTTVTRTTVYKDKS